MKSTALLGEQRRLPGDPAWNQILADHPVLKFDVGLGDGVLSLLHRRHVGPRRRWFLQFSIRR